ncbi:MAG: NUDIX domain-containing protein [Cyanobacteria bacterium J069]|nr:MAG: NUDIX domain-containing protein [Cyanobacteria bacterium J069]
MGKKKRIRPIAICLLRQGDRLLLHEGVDTTTGLQFGRPLGGGIDFGEHSRDAVIREIREELGAAITAVELVGILESIYVYEGEPGHELVFVYSGRFVDESLYEQPTLQVTEGERVFEARWRSLDELRGDPLVLVPEGLWELL